MWKWVDFSKKNVVACCKVSQKRCEYLPLYCICPPSLCLDSLTYCVFTYSCQRTYKDRKNLVGKTQLRRMLKKLCSSQGVSLEYFFTVYISNICRSLTEQGSIFLWSDKLKQFLTYHARDSLAFTVLSIHQKWCVCVTLVDSTFALIYNLRAVNLLHSQ